MTEDSLDQLDYQELLVQQEQEVTLVFPDQTVHQDHLVHRVLQVQLEIMGTKEHLVQLVPQVLLDQKETPDQKALQVVQVTLDLLDLKA